MTTDTRHLRPDEIGGYRRRTLPPDDLLRVDDHLARCDTCRARLGSPGRLGPSVAAMRRDFARAVEVDEHPAPEQLAAFVDLTLDEIEAEFIESHLEICRPCAEDVDDLRAVGISLRGSAGPSREGSRRHLAYAALTGLAAGLAGLLVWLGTRPAPSPSHEPGRAEAPMVEPAVPAPVNPPRFTLVDGGGTVIVHVDGSVRGLPALAPDELDAVRQALEDGRVTLPAFVGELGMPPGTLMSGAVNRTAFRPLRPVATAIETDRPAFEWTPVQDATAYVVSVFGRDFDKVLESPTLPIARWQTDAPLTRGRTYVWQVRASLPDREIVTPAPPAPEARFRVLSRNEADRLDAVRKRGKSFHLVLGVMLARAGALDEAERELEQLVAANPGIPEARSLLDSLRAQRRTGPGRP